MEIIIFRRGLLLAFLCGLLLFQGLSGTSFGDSCTMPAPSGIPTPGNLGTGAVSYSPLLSLTFFDVGQGDAILVRSREKTVLIDAGADNGNGFEVISSHLRKLGISKIDTAVITHPHSDHFGGFLRLLGSFEFGEFLYSIDDMQYVDRPIGREKGDGLSDLIKAIESRRIPYHAAKTGDKFDWGTGIEVALLHSAMDVDVSSWTADYAPGANDFSLVFRIAAERTSFLLMGDLQGPGESGLIKRLGANLRSTVLKVGHHGSRTSSTLPFLDQVAPRYAVIQVGTGNQFHHPSAATLNALKARGIGIFRTNKSGTVTISTDGTNETVEVETPPAGAIDLARALLELDSLSDQELAADRFEELQNEVMELAEETRSGKRPGALGEFLGSLPPPLAHNLFRRTETNRLFELHHTPD